MISIRPYNTEDYLAVKENLKEAEMFVPDVDTAENFHQKSLRDPESILIAEDNGEVVGNLFFMEDGWRVYLFSFAVKMKFRNQGVGKKILERAENILKNRGYTSLACFISDEKAFNAFYSKLGYKKEHVSPLRVIYKDL